MPKPIGKAIITLVEVARAKHRGQPVPRPGRPRAVLEVQDHGNLHGVDGHVGIDAGVVGIGEIGYSLLGAVERSGKRSNAKRPLRC